MAAARMSRRRTHTIRVAKRTLSGSRRWWFTCTCSRYMVQGCYEKQEALQFAAEHAKAVADAGQDADLEFGERT
jgi:hypothetical protein